MVFKIVMLNIRSLFPNVDQVRHFFVNYDMICLCETWLTNGHTNNMLTIPEYEIIRLDRTKEQSPNRPRRGGGLLIYIRKKLAPYVNIIDRISSISKDLEQLWILLESPNHRTEIVSVIYRPPAGNIDRYFDELRASVDHIQEIKPNAEITILGDINIDYKLRHTPSFNKLKDFEREYQLKQLITTPTRITPRNASLIDMIFTDMENIDAYGTLDVAISDHLPVFVSKKKPKTLKNISYTEGRSYKSYSKDDFQRLVRNDERWNSFWTQGKDPNELWDIIYEIILSAADKICPFVKMKINNNNPEWFSQEILEEIHYKNELFKTYKTSKTNEDWIIFKNQNSRVKSLIKSGKEEFIKETLNENSGNPRKFWRTINNTTGLGKTKIKDTNIIIKTPAGDELKDNDAAEYINNYYVNVGPNLAEKFPNDWTLNDVISGNELFRFSDTTEYEVLKLVKDIKISKSSAISEISTRLFKDAFEIIIIELTHLFNRCIQASIFPRIWGYAEVSPVPKTGDLRKVENWRPISQIKLPGKLLERILHTQLTTFTNNLLHKNQHGFRANRSTSTAIFDVMQKFFDAWNEKKYISCIFIDYSRAFDTIDHNILLAKLSAYGLDETSHKLMKSYLLNRKQRTNLQGSKSTYKPLAYGVPQGSILGPLLFILYTNDLFAQLPSDDSLYMYADDTLILSTGKTEDEAVRISQEKLDIVTSWCRKNKLTINKSKTKHMCITHKKHPLEKHISIDSVDLANVTTFEYLGVVLDNKLKLQQQVDKIYKKVSSKLYTFSIIRRYLTRDIALMTYKVMILPHFDYVDFVLDSATNESTDKLERLHKRAIRKIEYCLDYRNKQKYEDVLVTFGMTLLYQRRTEHLLTLMYKYKGDIIEIDPQRPKIELRSKNKVKLKSKFTTQTKVQKSPLYRGVWLWNKLPEDIQKSETVSDFKNKIRRQFTVGQLTYRQQGVNKR